MPDRAAKRKTEEEALRIIRDNAQRDRERILLQDRLDRAHADEIRRTEKALEWQRAPSRVLSRKSGRVIRFLYYAILIVLTPLSLGIVLIAHFAVKKLFFDKRG